MSALAQLLATIKAADPSGGHYHDQGEVLVDVPEFLQVEYEAASSQAQAVAGRWDDGRLVEVIAWHPSGEPWTIESIECGEDADSYGVPDSGWPCEEEEDE